MTAFRYPLLLFLLFAAAILRGESASFTNSLDMRFVSVPGSKLLYSVYPTRVADYAQFVEETGQTWPSPPFEQAPDHPAVNVSWEDAAHFSRWLTAREVESGLLPRGWTYRLPTEVEWMMAAMGPMMLEDSPGTVPELLFPWGSDWPPPENAGNYGESLGVDPFPYTSPTGYFPPNRFGLYDLGGNVWEWCLDFYEGARDLRVLKGGSFRMRDLSDLLVTSRVGNISSIRLPGYGFRLVLERE